MKFRAFFRYLGEACGIYFRNIIPMTFVLPIIFLLITIGLIIIGLVIGIPITLLASAIPHDILIEFNTTITVVSVIIALPIYFIAIALYSAVSSIYTFYITFKSKEDNYKLFLSLLQNNLWKIIKVSIMKWIRILIITIGCILVVLIASIICIIGLNTPINVNEQLTIIVIAIFSALPSIILTMRYYAIDYFVIAENANFTTARIKSTKIMNGFKISYLVSFLIINIILNIIYYLSMWSTTNAVFSHNIFHSLSFLALYNISSIIIYTICKHEAPKDIAIDDAAAKSLTQ